MNSNCKQVKGEQIKKGANYEEAMTKAFSEIFHNLKDIEADSKRQREKVDFKRRRQSAPARVLRDATETLQQPEGEGSSPTQPTSTPSTVQWVLECYEEEEDVEPADLSLGFIEYVMAENRKTGS